MKRRNLFLLIAVTFFIAAISPTATYTYSYSNNGWGYGVYNDNVRNFTTWDE